MRNFKSLLFICLVAGLFGCKKSIDPSFQNDQEEKGIKQLPSKDPSSVLNAGNTDANARTYTNFVNLTQISNGDYTDGHIRFTQIIYQTGDYLDGEPVSSLSFYFDPTETPNVLWSSTDGTNFVYVQGTAIGPYMPPFLSAWTDYQNDFDSFVHDTTATVGFPNIDDYIPSTTANGELVTKGTVVRRHSSSTTFAIAPPSFQPVVHPAGTNVLFGSLEVNGYIITVGCKVFSGHTVPPSGAVTYLTIEDAVTHDPVSISGFVGSYTKYHTSFPVTGEVTLSDGTIIPYSGTPGLL